MHACILVYMYACMCRPIGLCEGCSCAVAHTLYVCDPSRCRLWRPSCQVTHLNRQRNFLLWPAFIWCCTLWCMTKFSSGAARS